MTDFTSLTEAMAAGAERAVQLAADGRVNLDFSLDSLRVVEEQLASLHTDLPKGFFARLSRKGPSSEEIDLMAMTFGAYVGEVLRRQFGGHWSYENSLQPGVPLATLHLPDGGEIWPHVKVNKRLRMGPEENVWVYAQTIIGQLQANGLGGAA